MLKNNLAPFYLSGEELDTILSHIHGIEKLLAGKLVQLSSDERREIPKMGDKTVSFVQKTLEHANVNLNFVPPYMNVEDFQKDVKAIELLRQIYNPMFQLLESIEDTIMLSGSDAYSNALTFYNSVKSAKRNRVPNAQYVYQDLSSQFSSRGKRSANQEETAVDEQTKID